MTTTSVSPAPEKSPASLSASASEKGPGTPGGGTGAPVWDTAPVAERAWYRAVLDEPDPRRQLRLTAGTSRAVKERAGAVVGVIRDAAPVDPDIATLWGRIQAEFYDNQRAIVETLQKKKALRPGLNVTRATDILWTLNHPDLWLLLVRGRAWTPEQYEHWFGDTICAQLLKDSARRRPATRGNAPAPRG